MSETSTRLSILPCCHKNAGGALDDRGKLIGAAKPLGIHQLDWAPPDYRRVSVTGSFALP